MSKISTLTLRKKLGSVLDEVAENKEAAIVTRGNKPLVAIIPYEEYAKREERSAKRRQAADNLRLVRQKVGPKLGRLDTTAVIRKMREER